MEDKTSHYMILWFFLCLFMLSIFMLGWLMKPFFSVIILAAVVTGVCSPVYRYLNGKMSPALSSLVTCVLVFFILFIPILLFGGILSKEAYELYLMGKDALISDQLKNLLAGSQVFERANQFLANFNIQLGGTELNDLLSETSKIVGLFLYKQARALAFNTLNFLINFFFILLIIYFLLIDGHKLIRFIIELSPLPKAQDEKLIKKFKDIAGAILLGNGFCGLIQGILGGTVFAVFGLKSPFMWGFIMTLLAFLPVVGIGVVFIPAALYLILSGKTASGMFFIVFYIVLSGTVEYLLKPKLVGKRVQMHTLLVFFSIIGGLKLFGILGIIYGPLVVTAFLTLTDIYHSSYQKLVTNNTNKNGD